MRTSPISPPNLLSSSSSNALLLCSDLRRLQTIKPTIIPRTRRIANTMRTMIHVAIAIQQEIGINSVLCKKRKTKQNKNKAKSNLICNKCRDKIEREGVPFHPYLIESKKQKEQTKKNTCTKEVVPSQKS